MDKLLLAVMSDRTKYRLMRDSIPDDTVGSTTSWLLDWYGVYFRQNPKVKTIDYDGLASLIRLKVPNEQREQLAAALHIISSQADYKPNKDAVEGVVQTLHERRAAGLIGNVIARYNNGDEIDVLAESHKIAVDTLRATGQASIYESVDGDPIEIMRDLAEDRGIKFRQRCLHDNIKGLRGGDCVGFAARVDSGKTSFLADFATYAAPQVASLYPGRSILWGNNEGVTRNIIPRLYSAALNMDNEELVALSNTELHERYTAATGGCAINLVDIHGWSMSTLEQRILVERPALVIVDMIEHLKLLGGETNKVDIIEDLWKEFRELAVRYDFIGFGTAQVSVEGSNMLYPPGSAIKNSKTGAQGTFDVQIMMGSLDDPQFQNLRGFSTPKNKRAPVGKPSRIQAEAVFDGARCRFNDGA